MNLKRAAYITLIISLILVFALLINIFPAYFAPYSGEEPEDIISSPNALANPGEPSTGEKPDNIDLFELSVDSILKNRNLLKVSFADKLDSDYLHVMAEKLGDGAIYSLADALSEGVVDSENLHSLIGYTDKAARLIIEDDLYRTEIIDDVGEKTEIVFVGDVAFCDHWSLMRRYEARAAGVDGIVSQEVLDVMRSADITMANNEFVLSNGGTPIPGKTYTIRGKPENVNIYHEMGVDIVGMANNHSFDFHAVGLTDTLATLDSAGIAHLGAGENLQEARAPYYYIIGGRVVGITAGSAIDPWSTRGATDKQSGVFQIFDTKSMCEVIEEAREKSDIVVAYVHWGHENTTELTSGQKSMGKAFVDSGADLVLGMHSHCMQGCEYYKGKLIAYSLGNFTFSGYTLTAAMLKLTINEDGSLKNTFYPLIHESNFTRINSGEQGKDQMDLLKKLLINAVISDDYVITPKDQEN